MRHTSLSFREERTCTLLLRPRPPRKSLVLCSVERSSNSHLLVFLTDCLYFSEVLAQRSRDNEVTSFVVVQSRMGMRRCITCKFTIHTGRNVSSHCPEGDRGSRQTSSHAHAQAHHLRHGTCHCTQSRNLMSSKCSTRHTHQYKHRPVDTSDEARISMTRKSTYGSAFLNRRNGRSHTTMFIRKHNLRCLPH